MLLIPPMTAAIVFVGLVTDRREAARLAPEACSIVFPALMCDYRHAAFANCGRMRRAWTAPFEKREVFARWHVRMMLWKIAALCNAPREVRGAFC